MGGCCGLRTAGERQMEFFGIFICFFGLDVNVLRICIHMHFVSGGFEEQLLDNYGFCS